MNRRPRAISVPRSAPALLALALLIAACSGGDDADSGLGPESPGVTVTSTTGGLAAATTTTTTTLVAGQSPTTETTVAPPPSTTSAGATTTAAPGSPATTTTDPGGTGGRTTTTTTTTTSTLAPPTTVDPDGPVVRIGADDYRFTVEECLYYDGVDIALWGPGEAPDGTPAYLDMQIDTLRIDIGTQERYQGMEEHWLAGVGAHDDLVVSVDGYEVTVTGTFVKEPTGQSVPGELVVYCPLG